MSTSRHIDKIWPARAVTDGDGVRINRNANAKDMHTFDPFLLLDEMVSDDANDYIGGFPEHPHRGFETVTYMLEGRMQHRDHMGNTGELVSGSVQWMTAGRGVLHSEMPLQESGRLHGFQLWVNLPATEKLCGPAYREFQPEEIPTVTAAGVTAKVIAGQLQLLENGQPSISATGPVQGISTAPDFFDIHLTEGAAVILSVAMQKKLLLYVYEGDALVDGTKGIMTQQIATTTAGDTLTLSSKAGGKLLLLAGEPINEPISHWGPFVMNTPQEIDQALQDMRNGTLVQ